MPARLSNKLSVNGGPVGTVAAAAVRCGEAADGRARPAFAIGAFIFDVDGVIADTAEMHTGAWRRIANEEAIPFDESTADALRGLSREASLRHLLDGEEASPARIVELADRKNAYYLESIKQLTKVDVPAGAVSLLEGLAELGLKLAAVSLSRNARTVLLRTGVVDAFDVVIDGNDLSKSRRGLNRYLLAARVLHVEPGRCVVVEDSAAGISAARAAGMRSVGVGDPRRLCAATLVLDSLRGAEAGTLIRRLCGEDVPAG